MSAGEASAEVYYMSVAPGYAGSVEIASEDYRLQCDENHVDISWNPNHNSRGSTDVDSYHSSVVSNAEIFPMLNQEFTAGTKPNGERRLTIPTVARLREWMAEQLSDFETPLAPTAIDNVDDLKVHDYLAAIDDGKFPVCTGPEVYLHDMIDHGIAVLALRAQPVAIYRQLITDTDELGPDRPEATRHYKIALGRALDDCSDMASLRAYTSGSLINRRSLLQHVVRQIEDEARFSVGASDLPDRVQEIITKEAGSHALREDRSAHAANMRRLVGRLTATA